MDNRSPVWKTRQLFQILKFLKLSEMIHISYFPSVYSVTTEKIRFLTT